MGVSTTHRIYLSMWILIYSFSDTYYVWAACGGDRGKMCQAGPRLRRMHTELLLLHVRYGKRLNNFSHFAISAFRVLNTPNPLQRCINQKEKYSAVFFKNRLIFQSRPSHTGAK